MIQLPPRALAAGETAALNDLQAQIDSKTTFTEKATKAQSLWNSKGGVKGKHSFEIIRDTLKQMCVSVGICNYCEQSEANDIEHIHPKSFFPEYTFHWENYILACKQCNSGHKLDKGHVLDGADNLIELVRDNEPPFNRIAFINIRTEDPNMFMLLNPLTNKFQLIGGLSLADKNKAEATLSILELNERDTLIVARKSAARHYYDTLQRLVGILAAPDKTALEHILSPYDNLFDMGKSLEALKGEITNSIRAYISTYQHPSVWHSIKIVESKTNPKWNIMFKKIPDALNW